MVKQKSVEIVIPIFNEEKEIEGSINKLHSFLGNKLRSYNWHITVADNASVDNSLHIIKKLSRKLKNVSYIHLVQKGRGRAVKKAWISSDKDYFAYMDVDLSTDLKSLPQLLSSLEKGYDILITMAGNNKDNPAEFDRLVQPILDNKADFVQGSRYLPGGDFGNMPGYRMITTRYVHPLIFYFVSGKRITDSTNGFRAFCSSFLKDGRMNMNQDWLDHYELEPYLFYNAIKLGYKVTEVPVSKIYPDKKLGYSKMTPFISWWSILRPLFLLYFGIKK